MTIVINSIPETIMLSQAQEAEHYAYGQITYIKTRLALRLGKWDYRAVEYYGSKTLNELIWLLEN